MRLYRAPHFFVLMLSLIASPVFAMSSASYEINWDTISSGGDDFGSSASYQLNDTIGGVANGGGSSASYSLHAGYRYPDMDNTVGFSVGAAASSPSPAWTVFNNVNQVTVSSVTGFSVGDLIAVVENRGLSQQVAVGRITNIAGLVVTVDAFDGDQAGMSAVAAGGNDFVYLLTASSVGLGTISQSTAGTGVVGVSVFSTAPNGYAVYLTQNHAIRNAGLVSLASVADSAVTIGSEEYGFSVTGADTYLPNDNAIQFITAAEIASGAATPSGQTDKYAITFKAAVSSTTANDSYSHTTYYTVTARY